MITEAAPAGAGLRRRALLACCLLAGCGSSAQDERAIAPACLPLRDRALSACQERVADFRACPGLPADLFHACPELCSPDFPCSGGAAPPPLAGPYDIVSTLAFSDPAAEGIGDTLFGRAFLDAQGPGRIAIGVRQQDAFRCGAQGPLTYPAALFGDAQKFTLFAALLRRTPERCTVTLLAQSGELTTGVRPRIEVRSKYLNVRCEETAGYLHEYVETWHSPDPEKRPLCQPAAY